MMAPRFEEQRAKYLEVLGLAAEATEDDIKKAFKKLAFKCHPEKTPSKDATSEFKELSHAFKQLTRNRVLKFCTFHKCFHVEWDDDDEDDVCNCEKCTAYDYHDGSDESEDEEIHEDSFFEVLRESIFKRKFQSKKKQRQHKPSPEEEEEETFYNFLFSKRRNRYSNDISLTEEDLKKFHSYDEWQKARDPKKKPNQRTRKAKQKANQPLLEKPKPLSKKQLLANQIRRQKEAEQIREQLQKEQQKVKEKVSENKSERKRNFSENVLEKIEKEKKIAQEMEELKSAQELQERKTLELIEAEAAKQEALEKKKKKKEAKKARRQAKIEVLNLLSSSDTGALTVLSATVNDACKDSTPTVLNPTPLLPRKEVESTPDQFTNRNLKAERDDQLKDFLEKVKKHRKMNDTDEMKKEDNTLDSVKIEEKAEIETDLKQKLLNKHLDQYKELMKLQPCRHTESQLREEREKQRREDEARQQRELERLRKATKAKQEEITVITRQCKDMLEQEEELLRMERNYVQLGNDAELNDIQERYGRGGGGKQPIEKQMFNKKSTKEKSSVWKTLDVWVDKPSSENAKHMPTLQPARSYANPLLPQPAPPPLSNAWCQRQDRLAERQRSIDTLRPKNVAEEEEILRHVLELSKQEAIAEEQRQLERMKESVAYLSSRRGISVSDKSQHYSNNDISVNGPDSLQHDANDIEEVLVAELEAYIDNVSLPEENCIVKKSYKVNTDNLPTDDEQPAASIWESADIITAEPHPSAFDEDWQETCGETDAVEQDSNSVNTKATELIEDQSRGDMNIAVKCNNIAGEAASDWLDDEPPPLVDLPENEEEQELLAEASNGARFKSPDSFPARYKDDQDVDLQAALISSLCLQDNALQEKRPLSAEGTSSGNTNWTCSGAAEDWDAEVNQASFVQGAQFQQETVNTNAASSTEEHISSRDIKEDINLNQSVDFGGAKPKQKLSSRYSAYLESPTKKPLHSTRDNLDVFDNPVSCVSHMVKESILHQLEEKVFPVAEAPTLASSRATNASDSHVIPDKSTDVETQCFKNKVGYIQGDEYVASGKIQEDSKDSTEEVLNKLLNEGTTLSQENFTSLLQGLQSQMPYIDPAQLPYMDPSMMTTYYQQMYAAAAANPMMAASMYPMSFMPLSMYGMYPMKQICGMPPVGVPAHLSYTGVNQQRTLDNLETGNEDIERELMLAMDISEHASSVNNNRSCSPSLLPGNSPAFVLDGHHPDGNTVASKNMDVPPGFSQRSNSNKKGPCKDNAALTRLATVSPQIMSVKRDTGKHSSANQQSNLGFTGVFENGMESADNKHEATETLRGFGRGRKMVQDTNKPAVGDDPESKNVHKMPPGKYLCGLGRGMKCRSNLEKPRQPRKATMGNLSSAVAAEQVTFENKFSGKSKEKGVDKILPVKKFGRGFSYSPPFQNDVNHFERVGDGGNNVVDETASTENKQHWSRGMFEP